MQECYILRIYNKQQVCSFAQMVYAQFSFALTGKNNFQILAKIKIKNAA